MRILFVTIFLISCSVIPESKITREDFKPGQQLPPLIYDPILDDSFVYDYAEGGLVPESLDLTSIPLVEGSGSISLTYDLNYFFSRFNSIKISQIYIIALDPLNFSYNYDTDVVELDHMFLPSVLRSLDSFEKNINYQIVMFPYHGSDKFISVTLDPLDDATIHVQIGYLKLTYNYTGRITPDVPPKYIFQSTQKDTPKNIQIVKYTSDVYSLFFVNNSQVELAFYF